ncbi:MAG: hypothetical protein ACE5OZ_05720 [Candidatus Heimdallarchaeota archaeon]
MIPNLNDDSAFLKSFAARILAELGPDTPVHFTRYHPAYKFDVPPTPIKALEEARELAQEVGLRHSYLGNVPGHPYENSYCPNCHKLLIKRFSSLSVESHLTSDCACPRCGEPIAIFPSTAYQT